MALLLWVHYNKVVNKTFVSMMEALGYDVRLVYEKRDESYDSFLKDEEASSLIRPG